MGEGSRSYFYVDEAGDLTLFGRRGRILVGTPGCSRFFIVGVAEVPDPVRLRNEMRQLRSELLADPYLVGIPSMQPDRGKTAICFHAKDDCPEVRREVFRLLVKHDIKVLAAVRRKEDLARDIHATWKRGVRWRPDTVYDDLVKRLFRDALHKSDENVITVARRGKGDRLDAMKEAIRRAKRNFERKHGRPSDKPTDIRVDVPSNVEGLQAADYCLWALQRLYERGEDRYFDYIRGKFRLIMDLDDKRNRPYGEWYSDSNPLTSQKTKPDVG